MDEGMLFFWREGTLFGRERKIQGEIIIGGFMDFLRGDCGLRCYYLYTTGPVRWRRVWQNKVVKKIVGVGTIEEDEPEIFYLF